MSTPAFPALHGKSYPTTLAEQIDALATDEEVLQFTAARRRLALDPYRPLYHFAPPENIMNDPNGLCQWQGHYHLFYQFRPDGQDRVHWGHAVSEDLIAWRDLPPALYPDVERDCFSGQTLVEPHRVIAIYHGTHAGNGIATADDPLLLNWRKHPANPVIRGDVAHSGGTNIVEVEIDGVPIRIFDPCIWSEEDGYYSVSGTFKDGTRGIDCVGVLHLFHSTDLATWSYCGPLLEDAFWAEPGEDLAVPNFWPIGNGKHMLLLFSHKHAGRYYIGRYDTTTHRFHPERHGRMNYGPWTVGSLHAPSATIDNQGRFLGIFNVKEGKPAEGWDNVMTLPRRYWLDTQDQLCMEPIDSTHTLRLQPQTIDAQTIPANSETVLFQVGGKAIEIEAVLLPGEAREVGLTVLRSPDGVEQTRISFFRDNHRRFLHSSLQIDVSASSTRADVFARTPEIGPLALEPDEPLRLNIFVDRSLIEVFANQRQCLTVRVYPERLDSTGIALFARGASAELQAMTVWQMKSIWPELEKWVGK